MRKINLFLAGIFFLLIASCEREPELRMSQTQNVGNRHFAADDYSIYHGRIVFKDWESWVDVMNNFNNEDSIAIFHELIALQGSYTPCNDFNGYFDSDTNDYLHGFFLNEDHLFQVDTVIMYWDLEKNRIRSINLSDEEELIQDMLAGNDDPAIRESYLEYENPTTQRPYAACSYCALGAIAVGLGCPAGLLELYACYYCWDNW